MGLTPGAAGPFARGVVVAPVSNLGAAGATAAGAPGATGRGAIGGPGRGAAGAPGATGGPPTLGGRGALRGTVAAGGRFGRAGGGTGMDGGGALGTGEVVTVTAVVVLRGASRGAGGSFTGAVADLGAGGGSGAEGSWIGAVARLGGASIGGTPDVAGETGEVASRGWVAPAPGRDLSVMRTVSFFRGTAAVFGVLGGGGIGVLSGSLMIWGKTWINSEFII